MAGKINLNFITKNSNLIFPPHEAMGPWQQRFFWRASKKNSPINKSEILKPTSMKIESKNPIFNNFITYVKSE